MQDHLVNVTVCELPDDSYDLSYAWSRLAEHIQEHDSQIVLLPEMPFSPWLARTRRPDPAAWRASVEAHERWLERLVDLSPALVLGSRPVIRLEKNTVRWLNEGFAWDATQGLRAVHTKYYLPDDEGFWEASWYQRGDGDFSALHVGPLCVGFMICTELWFQERARQYAKQGVHMIACPRATLAESVDKWLVGGRAAGIAAGAYCLSSNHTGPRGSFPHFGGHGWVSGPEGEVLGLTTQDKPFLTVKIDLRAAEQAKTTYPRYVAE
jgi:N-carbamoylputrescine amidase